VMGKTPEEVLGGCAVQSGKMMRGETETCRRGNGGGRAAGAESKTGGVAVAAAAAGVGRSVGSPFSCVAYSEPISF
jgi:hypothetical protein